MNPDQIDLLTSFRQLMAANKSQQERLEEFASIIGNRDKEIGMLQSMLSEASENRSKQDNQLMELANLQKYMSGLRQQVAGTEFAQPTKQQVGDTVSLAQELERVQQAYTKAQSQLSELEFRLQELTSKNLLLQQQVSRMAALESMLAALEKEGKL